MTSRIPIPENIKREVRKKCGFGCIFCGGMVCEYEHITPYHETKDNSLENLVLLCRNHHGEVTCGRKSKESVIKAAKNPFCLRGTKFGALYNLEPNLQDFDVFLGSITMKFLQSCPGANIVVIGDEPIFSVFLDEGIPQFSFKILDADENIVVNVERNCLIALNKAWDVELRGKYLRVRHGPKLISLKIKIDESKIIFEKMFLHRKGSGILCHGNEIIFIENSERKSNLFAARIYITDKKFSNVIGIKCKKYVCNISSCISLIGDLPESKISNDKYKEFLSLRPKSPPIELNYN